MKMMKSALAVTLLALMPLPALAELAKPSGEVLLTMTGNISETNTDGAAQFDLGMLRNLPNEEFETTTIWTEGVQRFKGVPLDVLLDTVGADGSTLRSVAINAYQITIPTAADEIDGAIVAYEMNGNTMSIRDKGPLWIVYPYDADPRFKTEVIYSRSIWQLEMIEVMD